MNNLPQLTQPFNIAQPESLYHRFKGAVFAMMRELSAKHVEGNTVFDVFAFCDEVKARTFVDKLFDHPGRRQAIWMNVVPRDPTAALVIMYGQCIIFRGCSRRFTVRRLSGAQKLPATFV